MGFCLHIDGVTCPNCVRDADGNWSVPYANSCIKCGAQLGFERIYDGNGVGPICPRCAYSTGSGSLFEQLTKLEQRVAKLEKGAEYREECETHQADASAYREKRERRPILQRWITPPDFVKCHECGAVRWTMR